MRYAYITPMNALPDTVWQASCFSVYMHHLLEVDADPAPVPWGAECALSTVCFVGHEEQEIIKIPSGTKTIGQMDRTKEKENMHGKEAEEPFQEAQSPSGGQSPTS